MALFTLELEIIMDIVFIIILTVLLLKGTTGYSIEDYGGCFLVSYFIYSLVKLPFLTSSFLFTVID